MTERFPETFRDEHVWMLPVVAETYNGVLNDINAQPVGREHVRAALDAAAPGPVAEGQVGGGAGMIAYEFAGGSGTSSRVVPIEGRAFTVAAFVQANHGVRDWLTVLGVPVGRRLRDDLLFPRETGSIVVAIATDAPLLPHQLRRVARRCTIGIGRGGSVGGNNSGDIFLAFTTANPAPLPGKAPAFLSFEAVNDERIDPIYEATVQATEEAVVNAMIAAEDRIAAKPAGHLVRAISHDALMAAMREGQASAAARRSPP
jgi:D-aminopeptidase